LRFCFADYLRAYRQDRRLFREDGIGRWSGGHGLFSLSDSVSVHGEAPYRNKRYCQVRVLYRYK
jgi:hypothetical protein